MAWGPKDPDAIRDYGIDWTADIGANTIVTSTWLLNDEDWPDTGATLSNEAQSIKADGTGTIIRLGGGTLGESYKVTNRVVLSNGERDDKTEILKIKAR